MFMERKKRTTIYIDPDVMDVVGPYIRGVMNLNMSQYLNNHLRDLKRVIEGSPHGHKKPSEMTLQEFTEVVQYWMEKGDEE
jgi:hypothetical protein